MKSLKEIEKMSLEELEAISSDEGIIVPEGFRNRIEAVIDAEMKVSALTEDRNQGRRWDFRHIGAAAAVLLLIGLGIGTYRNDPKDTFDDPYLAYAEIEKAFAMMSGEIQKGLAMAEDSEDVMDKVVSIFEQ